MFIGLGLLDSRPESLEYAVSVRALLGWLFRSLWILCAVVGSGCAPLTAAGYRDKAPRSEAPLPARARIFLVAGGVDVANFAAEVVEQRALWRRRGFTDEEIVCYYARPTRSGFRGDRRQYRALLAELDGCYLASTELLREHLRIAASQAPPFLYLYISSHGIAGLVEEGSGLAPDERALLDRYVIQLGEGPGYGIYPEPILEAYRQGRASEELLWTPAVLAEALSGFAAEIPKIVVLQGCHSGGFLYEPRRKGAEIRGIPNLTAIASARFDRTSFGCNPGPDMTYFGSLLIDLLERTGDDEGPAEIDWFALFGQLARGVAALERREGVTASLPVYYGVAAAGGPWSGG